MEKLARIQRELKSPKNQSNDFGKYKYRSCEDILEAVKPLLDGAILTLSDEMVEVGGRVYVKATALFVDDKYEKVTTAFAREPEDRKGMDASQITGTASSYSRKYALNGLFLIDDTKDADTMDKPDKQPPEKRQDTPRTTKPPDPAHTAEQSEEQLLKALKVKLGKKMEGLNDDEKKSLYAYSVGDKPVTPVLLQGIIDNYSTFKKDWEDMV